VAKPQLGTKRICPACGSKYYDLNRDPITCPNCGTVFEVVMAKAAPPERVVEAVVAAEAVAVEPEAVLEREEGVVSLEEAEEDAALDTGPDADEDEEPAIAEADIEVEEDIEASDADAFLEDEAEEGDDVADLLDVDGAEEDEV
jgi:uncharacterized protein (TIGR02300 family)